MSSVDKSLITNMLNEFQGVSVDAVTSERIASVVSSVNETLGPLDTKSFFDTEPAQFDSLLSRVAKPSEDQNGG